MKILLRCLIIMVSKALINIDLIQSISVQGRLSVQYMNLSEDTMCHKLY